MGSADGGELGRLLDEQAAYYRSLAPDYLGWQITVTSTSGPFYRGAGGRA